MANDFRFLPDIATADIAFEAYGKDISQLFENAGLALESAMVETATVKPLHSEKLKIKKEKLEELLFDFLEELVFLKDSKRLLFNRIKCDIQPAVRSWQLTAELRGERIDSKRHKLGVDVKAVTKHMFEIKQLPEKDWYCRVVLDV